MTQRPQSPHFKQRNRICERSHASICECCRLVMPMLSRLADDHCAHASRASTQDVVTAVADNDNILWAAAPDSTYVVDRGGVRLTWQKGSTERGREHPGPFQHCERSGHNILIVPRQNGKSQPTQHKRVKGSASVWHELLATKTSLFFVFKDTMEARTLVCVLVCSNVFQDVDSSRSSHTGAHRSKIYCPRQRKCAVHIKYNAKNSPHGMWHCRSSPRRAGDHHTDRYATLLTSKG